MRPTVAMILIATATIAGAAGPARADSPFEAAAKKAERVRQVDRLVWALTATCEQGDDVSRRQCRMLRDAAAERLRGATVLVDASAGAIEIGAFDAAKKASPVIVHGCITCTGVASEGKKWFVVANKAAPKVTGDKVEAAVIGETARTFKDEAAADAWKAGAGARLRTQLLVNVLDKNYTWQRGSVDGIAVEVVGHRVYDRCDGSIISASPESGPGPAEKKLCGPVVEVKPEKIDPNAGLPPELSKDQILAVLRPAIEEAKDCYDTHGVAGDAKVKVTIGGDGSVLAVNQTGAFVGTPTGECIEAAIKKAVFPKSRKAKTTVSYPVLLR